MNNTSKIIIAAAAGALVGAAVGILFAPEKGSDLRKKVADGARKVADDAKEKWAATKKEWKEKLEELA